MNNQDNAIGLHDHPINALDDVQKQLLSDEKRNLAGIMQKLDEALEDAEKSVLRIDQEYREAKQYMVDYFNEMDSHEKLQNESLLEQTDRMGTFTVKLQQKILKLKDSPYFARIDFASDDEAVSTPYYIGRFGFTYNNEKMIFDWRAPVSGMFYDYDVGRAGFDAPVGRINGNLTRKRQFKIKNGEMEYALESKSTVQDDVLQRELAHTSDEKMKSIISTIQREQNVIIRNERAKNMIIQGVAGSGKTSIALHRIAFLLYQFKNQLTAQEVTILSPNKVFADYISNVIPELGEEPICELSFSDVAKNALKDVLDFKSEKNPLEISDEQWKKRVQFKSTRAFLRLIEEYRGNMNSRIFVAEEYSYGKFAVSAEWIENRFAFYGKLPIAKRLSVLANDVRSELRSKMSMWEEPPKATVILRSLKKMLKTKDTLTLYKDFYHYIGKCEMFVMLDKKTLEWDDVFPYLYFYDIFEGLEENREVRHLVVDEMQDYTPIQYAVLNLIYPCQKTILGDFGQILNPCHLHTLGDIKTMYADAEFVELNKSYRSTYEIMDYAKRISNHPHLEMVERHGVAVQAAGCEDEIEEMNFISNQIEQFKNSGNASLGIVTKTNADAKKLFDKISQKYNVNLLTTESTQFVSGISITSIQMAKGLEFDEVIVHDVSNVQYDEDYDRNLLFIACTRAMHKLTISYIGTPSRFLPVQPC